jgi:hypothetical protein
LEQLATGQNSCENLIPSVRGRLLTVYGWTPRVSVAHCTNLASSVRSSKAFWR